MTEPIEDLPFLKKLLLTFKQKGIGVNIIPQGDGKWGVFVDVPGLDGYGSKEYFVAESVLEWALEKALDEYDRRYAALKVLMQ